MSDILERYQQAEIERLREDRDEIYAKWQLDRVELLTETERLREQVAVWLECYQTEKAKREELIKRVREAIGE